SDLRESGSIEQDADVVIFIHRPEYYKKTPSPQEEGLAEIIIAKQRNGPTGIVKLAFLKELTKFESISDYSNIQDTYQTINEDEDDDSVSF
ncbi:MAG: DnaB-like helicase C-terminal domain-containing protein, partial [Sulfurihydrogenibium sp.]